MGKLIVIAGPTASGKTSLSVQLAKQLNAPIISADSRQFYKELEIGTAKPTSTEMEGVPHYFIDSHSVQQPLSSGKYEKEAVEIVNQLIKTHSYIIVVGGSGLFINALIYGTDQLPHDKKIRDFWNKEWKEKGLDFLQKKVHEIDKEYYNQVDIQNPLRLIRAIEVFEITGIPYSQQRKSTQQLRYPTVYFVIDWPRSTLYERINHRVDIMIQNGLIDEVKRNIEFKSLQPLNTVGYKEIFEYLEQKTTKEEAIELIKRNTRRYAKRQLTWFRKEANAIWIKAENQEEMLSKILVKIKE